MNQPSRLTPTLLAVFLGFGQQGMAFTSFFSKGIARDPIRCLIISRARFAPRSCG